MGLFSDVQSQKSILKNEDVLDYTFLPDKLPGRETEINIIASALKPLFVEKKPSNLFIHGIPGIGKTATIKYVLNEVNNTSNNIKGCFINCWKSNTSYAILTEIAKNIGLVYPKKGISTEEVTSSTIIKAKQYKGIILVLDEADKCKDYDLLYNLIEELRNKIAIILISNNKDFLSYLDLRMKSRLCVESHEFKHYEVSTIREILSERVNKAYNSGAIDPEALRFCISQTFKNKDIRIGLYLLLKAAKYAEADESQKVLRNHVEEASKKIDLIKEKEIGDLNAEEQKIISLVKKMPGSKTGELYNNYVKENGELTSRSFRKYLTRLAKLGVLNIEETGKGFRGRSRVVWLR